MAVDLNQDDNCLIPQSTDLQEIRRRSVSSWTHAGLQLLSHLNPPTSVWSFRELLGATAWGGTVPEIVDAKNLDLWLTTSL